MKGEMNMIKFFQCINGTESIVQTYAVFKESHAIESTSHL